MKLNSILALLALLILSSITLLPIEKGYFTFPIRPGERNFLSGSMGELRNNHFHGGLDIKTYGEIGLPVYAAAEGYISRISVDPAGYGKRIAITHPNGFVTHYGHLDHFSEEIERFVTNEQYKAKKFDIELFPTEGLLKIEEGEVFAFSGNTGSSGGPHLHFEIRDLNDNVYNPLDFGFEEIYDKQAPRIYRIALKPLNAISSVDGKFSKQYYRLGYLNNRYVVNQNIKAYGKIGLEIKAYDRMNGTYNKYGIQEVQVWVDGVRYFEQKIKHYPILITRQINLHVDYNDVYERGDWYHKCYVSPGNDLPFYDYKADRGAINISDGEKHEIQVFVKDSYENVSLLEFSIKGEKMKLEKEQRNLIAKPEFSYDLQGNELRMELSNVDFNKTLEVYGFYKKTSLTPISYTQNSNIYKYDLSRGIPDSIQAADSTYFLPYKYMILPKKKTEYYFDPIKITFDDKGIHDTLFLEHEISDSSLSLHYANVPLSSYMKVEWQINNPKYINVYQVYRKLHRGMSFVSNNWNGNKISFSTRNFGDYVLAQDTLAPYVRLIYNTGSEMKLRIRDNLSGIKSYNVNVNGEWILMEYDAKRNLLTSKRRENTTYLRGDCQIIIEDNAGNVKSLNLKL
ncbi:M23 family metallopeptidase [Hyphobacterium sp. CCMP332]|nr:M23 family metallopeptidase [Hyphobacterium sp. CCMP332]